MKKQIAPLIILLLLLATQLSAQQYFQWTSKAGGKSNDYVNSIVCPANDKIYATGGFVESIIADDEEAKGEGMRDIFMACFDSEGNTQWIKALGGPSVDNATRLAIGDKCIYMLGTVTGNISLGKQNFNGGEKSLFVASWSLKGKINWLKRFDYSGNVTSDVLEVSPNGEIITGGMFQGSIKVDEKDISSLGKKRAFVITLSSEGKPLKSTISSGEGEHRFLSATFNSKNECYYLFSTNGPFNFGNNPEIYEGMRVKSGLILQKNTMGDNSEWAQYIEDSGYSEGIQIVSRNEDVFLCANFRGQLKTSDTTLQTASIQSVALLKFNNKGKVSWGEVIEGPSRCRAMDAMCNKSGNLLVTGYYKNGYKIQQTEIVANSHEGNIFLIQFDKEGKVAWHNEPGDNAPNFSKSFAISQTGDILLAGGFREELQLENQKLESAGSTDVFVAKYFNCDQLETKITDPGPVCQGEIKELSASGQYTSFLWDNTHWGDTYEISGPGTYFVKAYDALGCGASDTLEIAPAEVADIGLPEEEEVVPGGEITLEANVGFSSYLWSDGETGYKKIVPYNQAKDSITLVLTAETFEGCSAKDTCIVRFQKEENLTQSFIALALKVYPNPVEDILWWELDLPEADKVTVKLTDGNSKTVLTREIGRYLPRTRAQIDVHGLASGNYLLTVSFGKVSYNEKIVKR